MDEKQVLTAARILRDHGSRHAKLLYLEPMVMWLLLFADKRMTQKDVATGLGCSRQTVAKYLASAQDYHKQTKDFGTEESAWAELSRSVSDGLEWARLLSRSLD